MRFPHDIHPACATSPWPCRKSWDVLLLLTSLPFGMSISGRPRRCGHPDEPLGAIWRHDGIEEPVFLCGETIDLAREMHLQVGICSIQLLVTQSLVVVGLSAVTSRNTNFSKS